MSSQLTVALVRQQLYTFVDPEDQASPLFLQRLNEAQERIILDASYKGNIVDATYRTTTNGMVTLPAHIDSIQVATVQAWPTPVYNTFARFVEVGPGLIQIDNMVGTPIWDLGDGFVTTDDIPSGDAGYLRTALSLASDVGKTVRYFGLDEDGDEIFDSQGNAGEEVTLANPTVTTTHQFSKVTGVQKEFTNGRITLAWMDGVTPTVLSTYLPGETVISYHRYALGDVNENTTLEEQTIAFKCRRRFLPLYAETDFLPVGTIGALKMAFMALNAETAPAASMRETAKGYWMECFDLLNKQHKTTRGGARGSVNFQPQAPGILPVWNST